MAGAGTCLPREILFVKKRPALFGHQKKNRRHAFFFFFAFCFLFPVLYLVQYFRHTVGSRVQKGPDSCLLQVLAPNGFETPLV